LGRGFAAYFVFQEMSGGLWDDWFGHRRLLPHPFRGFIAERVGVEEIGDRVGFPPFRQGAPEGWGNDGLWSSVGS
jgi:hypothetical protein